MVTQYHSWRPVKISTVTSLVSCTSPPIPKHLPTRTPLLCNSAGPQRVLLPALGVLLSELEMWLMVIWGLIMDVSMKTKRHCSQ